MSQQPKSYHPALPSILEAKQDYTRVISDHVPIIASIPLRSKQGENKKLKVLSWNVLEGDAFNGFAPLGRSAYGESEEQRNARYERIADGLASAVKNNEPQFITLQEISADAKRGELYKKIKAKLGDEYACISIGGEVVDANGCITLYNTKQFKPVQTEVKNARSPEFEHRDLGGSISTFESNDGDLTVRVLSAHPGFNAHPLDHETNIKNFLKQPVAKHTREIISIAAGDYNCPVMPLDNKQKNISTSVAPSIFRDSELQGACAIDGIFYSQSDRGSNITCKQAQIEHLNPSTGNPFAPEELKPLDIASLPDSQRKEISEFRMVMCVDDSFTKVKAISHKYTIFEYENYLRKEFNDPTMLVRFAKNINNESGIGITLNRDLFQRLQARYAGDSKFQFRQLQNEKTGQPCYAIFTSEANFPTLRNILEGERPCLKKVASYLKSSGYGAVTITSALIGVESILTAMDKSLTGKMNNTDFDIQVVIAVLSLAIAAGLTIKAVYDKKNQGVYELNFENTSPQSN